MERIVGVEVFKGGSSILFGPNTVGGVDDMISRPLSPRPLRPILDTRYDSYGDYSANLHASGNVFSRPAIALRQLKTNRIIRAS